MKIKNKKKIKKLLHYNEDGIREIELSLSVSKVSPLPSN